MEFKNYASSNYAIHEQQYKKAKERGELQPWGIEEENRDFIDYCQKHTTWRQAQKLQTTSIMELGCGPGINLFALYKTGIDLHGVDISPSAIKWGKEIAEKRNIPCKLECKNLLTLDESYFNKFDLLLDGHCLHCIIGDEDRSIFINTAFNLLKPNGTLLIESMVAPACSYLQQFIDERGVLIQDGIAFRQLVQLDELQSSLKSVGFEIISSMLNPDDGSEKSQSSVLISCYKPYF